MTKFILHGGYTRFKSDLNDSFYKEICNNIPNDGNILFTHFARSDEEIPERFKGEKERLLKQAGDKKFTTTLALKDDFINQLKNADVIYIDGGNTDQLIKTIKKFPGFTELIKGKTVVGSSAGAYLLSTYYHSAGKDEIFEGLGILPIRIVCHYKSEHFPAKGDPVERMKEYPDNLKLIALHDCEWKTPTTPT